MTPPPSWLYGLQEYFEFTKNYKAKLFVDQIISVYFSDNRANSVKNLCLSDSGPAEDKLPRFNFYFKMLEDTDVDFLETCSIMRKRISDEQLLDIIHKYIRKEHEIDQLSDSLSRGQVRSKIWLATELANIRKDFDQILLCAGWFGQLRLYLDQAGITYKKIRTVDIDKDACDVSDHIFNINLIQDWVMKSSTYNINDIVHNLDHCTC